MMKQQSNSTASLQHSPTGNMTPLPYRQTANQLILLNKEESKEEEADFRFEAVRQQNLPKNSWSQFYTQNASNSIFMDSDLASNQNRLSQIEFKKRSSIPDPNTGNPTKNSFTNSLFNPQSDIHGLNQISQNEESKTEESEIGRSDQQADQQSRDLIQLTSQQEESKQPHSDDKEEGLFVEEIKDSALQLSSGDNFEERKNQHQFSFANPHFGLLQDGQTHTTMKSKNWGAQPNQRKNKGRSQTREQQPVQVVVGESNNHSQTTIQVVEDQVRMTAIEPEVTENANPTQTQLNNLETGISPSHQTNFPTQNGQNLTSEISPVLLQASNSLEPFTPGYQERSSTQVQIPKIDAQANQTSLPQTEQLTAAATDNQCKNDLSLTLSQLHQKEANGGPKDKATIQKLNSQFDKELESVSYTLDLIAFVVMNFTLCSRSYFKDYKYQQDMETLFERYAGFVYITRTIITNEKIRFNSLFLFYCILQIPWDAQVPSVMRYSHILMTTAFTYILAFTNNWAKPKKEQKTHEKMDILQKNENNLKQLMQLIPYGIAVVDLENIANYNKSFARTIGLGRRKNQILEALQKFQRKLKIRDFIKERTRELVKKSNSDKPPSEKVGMGPLTSSLKQNNNLANTTSLFEDLTNIQRNRENYFKESKHIFDIYYVEKEDWFPQAGTNQRQRDAKGQKTPKTTLDKQKGQRNSKFDYDKNQDSNVNANHQQARKIYSISISPITWLDKECFMITVKDITHEKVINQKEVMDKLRNMIFKSFSHELKTPLNGIIMSVDTSKFISKQLIQKIKKERKRGNLQLDDAFQQSKQLKVQINVMESCSYVLKNIMHDFFDYNQLQTNELSLNIKQFDLTTFVKDIKRIVKQQVKFDHVKFKCTVDYQSHMLERLASGASPDFLAKQIGNSNPATTVASQSNDQPVKMSADKERLQQILLNLLMNSIKFTTKGSIELNVFVQTQATPPCVIFRVKDTGIGIEEERLPYIFNLFEKDENSNLNDYLNLNTKSARMGLPISQNLCQLMGGTIRVRSKFREGSMFQFRLPLNSEDDFKKTIELQNQKINSILENERQDSQKQLLPKRKKINQPEFSLPLSSQDQQRALFIGGAQGDGNGFIGNSPQIDLQKHSILTISTNQLPQQTNREEKAPLRKKAMLVSRPEGFGNFDFSSKIESMDDNDRDFQNSNSKQALWLQSIKNQSRESRSIKNIKSEHIHFNNSTVIQKKGNGKFTTPQTSFKIPYLLSLEENKEIKEDTLKVVQQSVQLSDEDEYCCKIEDDEEDIEEEEDQSHVSEEEEVIESLEDQEEHEEDLEDDIANEDDEQSAEEMFFDERYASNMRHRQTVKTKKQGGFVYQMQKKVGQFEFVFSSARGRSNSRMNSGRDGFYEENGGTTPIIRNSSDIFDKVIEMQLQQKGTFQSSQYLHEKTLKNDQMAKDSKNFTFTSQLEKMEREKGELEQLKEINELNQISSRSSVTSKESEKHQKNGTKLEEVRKPSLICRRKTIAVGRVSQSQNTFEEMMRLAQQVDKRPNKKIFSKRFMPSLNSSFQKSLNESRHTSNSNNMSHQTAQFQSKVQLMKQASKRQIIVKNKLGKAEEQNQKLNQLSINHKLNSDNTQARDDGSQRQNQSLIKSHSSNNNPPSQSKLFQTSSKLQIEGSQEIQSLSFLNYSFAYNQNTSGLEQQSFLYINQNQATLDQNVTTSNAYPPQDQHLSVMMGLNSSFKRHSVSYYSRGDSNQTQLNQIKFEHFDSMNNNAYQRDKDLIHNLVDPPELCPPFLNLKEGAEDHKTESAQGSSMQRKKSIVSNLTPNSNILKQTYLDQSQNVHRQLSHFSGKQLLVLGSSHSKIPYLQVHKNKDYKDIASKINSSIAAIQPSRPLSPNSATIKPFQQQSDSLGTPLHHMASNPHEQLNYSQNDNSMLLLKQKNENNVDFLLMNQSKESPRRPSSRFKQRTMTKDKDTISNKDLQAPLQSLSDSKKSIFRNLDSKTFNMKTSKKITGMQKRMNFLGQTGIGSSERSLLHIKKAQNTQQPSKFQGSKKPQSISNYQGYSFANNQLDNQGDAQSQQQNQTFFSKAQISQARLLGAAQDPRPLHSYSRLNQFLAAGNRNDRSSFSQKSKESKRSQNLSVANNSSDQRSSSKGALEEFNDSCGYIQDIRKRRKDQCKRVAKEREKTEVSSPISPLNYSKIIHHRNNKKLLKSQYDIAPNNSNSDQQDAQLGYESLHKSKQSEKVVNHYLESPNKENSLHKQAIIKNSTKSLIENLQRKQQRINEELDEKKQKFRNRVIEEEIKEVNSNKYSLDLSRSKPKSSMAIDKDLKLNLNFENFALQSQQLYQDNSQSEQEEEGNMLLDSDRPSDLKYDPRLRDITSNVGRFLFSTTQNSPLRRTDEEIKLEGSLLFVPQPLQHRSASENQKIFPRSFGRQANDMPSLELQVFDSRGALIPLVLNQRESQMSNNPFSVNQSPIKVRLQNRSSLAIDRLEFNQVLADGPLNFFHDQLRIMKPQQESSRTPRDTNFLLSEVREEIKNQYSSQQPQKIHESQSDQSVIRMLLQSKENDTSNDISPSQNMTSQQVDSSKRAKRMKDLKEILKLKIKDSNLKLERVSVKDKMSTDSILQGSKISQSANLKQENSDKLSVNQKQQEYQSATCQKKPTTFTFEPLEIQRMPNQYLGIPYVQNAKQKSSNSHNFLSPQKLQNQLLNLRRQSAQPKDEKLLNENLIDVYEESSESQNEESKASVILNHSSFHNSSNSKILLEPSKDLSLKMEGVNQTRESLQDRRIIKAFKTQNMLTLQSPQQESGQTSQDTKINLIKNSSSISQSPFIKLQLQSQSDISSNQVNRLAQDSAFNINGQVQEAPKIKRNNQMGMTKLFLNIKSDERSESDSDSDDSKNDQTIRNDVHECPQILVVDDVQMNRYAVEQMLSLIFNLKILQAENGKQAIDLLLDYYNNKKCSCPGVKLILMDIEMPIMDGITATRKIRQLIANGRTKNLMQESQAEQTHLIQEQEKSEQHLPSDLAIVALTAYMDEKHNCLQAGMSDFMTKPTSKGELEEILKKFDIIN